jgi:hypothetical protein
MKSEASSMRFIAWKWLRLTPLCVSVISYSPTVKHRTNISALHSSICNVWKIALLPQEFTATSIVIRQRLWELSFLTLCQH